MNAFPKSYLGDGVYVALDVYGDVLLTTENGLTATNTIVLEPEVLAKLECWLSDAREQVQRARSVREGSR